MENAKPAKKCPLPWIIGLGLLFALIMGPGPGLNLVNPDPADPEATRVVLGLPIVYAWGLLWFGVQVALLLTAYFTVWSRDEQ